MSAALHAIAASWAAAEKHQYNACHHCDHHTWSGQQLCCQAPTLQLQARPRPVALVRRREGGCGPEAVHMAAPFLALQ